MSWRLEPRDLSGQWHLDDSELSLVLETLQTIRLKDRLSQELQTLCDSLDLSELAGLMSWQGEQWLASHQRQPLHVSAHHSTKHNVSKRLTPRLKGVIDLYSPGQANIDLGTDHAHLPLLLVRSQKAPLAFGVDIVGAPLENACKELYKTKMQAGVSLLLSNGMDVFIDESHPLGPNSECVVHSFSEDNWQNWASLLQSKKVTVTICGVGGTLAADLIKSLPTWVSEVIVQANDQEHLVDQAFDEKVNGLQGFYIDTITATIEKKRLFLNKRAHRKSVNAENVEQRYFGVNHALWRWVLLSRACRRISLTPKNHCSLESKRKIMQRAVKGFFSFVICSSLDASNILL